MEPFNFDTAISALRECVEAESCTPALYYLKEYDKTITKGPYPPFFEETVFTITFYVPPNVSGPIQTGKKVAELLDIKDFKDIASLISRLKSGNYRYRTDNEAKYKELIKKATARNLDFVANKSYTLADKNGHLTDACYGEEFFNTAKG